MAETIGQGTRGDCSSVIVHRPSSSFGIQRRTVQGVTVRFKVDQGDRTSQSKARVVVSGRLGRLYRLGRQVSLDTLRLGTLETLRLANWSSLSNRELSEIRRTRFHDARCPMNDPRGFSLLEVVIALAIVTVAVVGLMQVFQASLRSSRRSGMSSEISFLAQRLIEETKTVGVDRMLPSGEDGEFRWTLHSEPISVEGQVAASAGPLEGLPQPRQLSVTVAWDERGRERTETFVAYIYE